ncbi:endospore germination permease [Psychrobacillus soli]|uniref:Spore gernimation protein n=1 Tax=Psychrobacillus soli TaxID=1543965 RepID=A0A544TM23_9BACI|nr:endospore germination permease [Psychrobacillus soli]TQR18504.1 spore gernimation protein [Psychrobacillus soli]
MKHTGSISMLHVIFLSMTVIGLKNHVTIIPPLLNVAGRDGWLSVLFSTLVLLPWGLLLFYINKKSNQEPMKDWLKQKIGKVSSSIFLFLLAISLLLLASLTISETLQWVKTTFLPETPLFILLLLFTILCVLLITTSIQTIVITNVIVLVGVVAFGFFAAFTNIQVKNYELLRPFMEHGFEPVIKGMVYPASGIIELFLFLFIQHKVKGQIRFRHYVTMILILTGLTLGPLIGAITEFGPTEAAKQRFPAYEEWGLVAIGRFIEHLDFFSIYQWLTGTFIRVGLMLYIIVDLFNLHRKKKKIWMYIAPPFFLISLSLLLISGSTFDEMKGKYVLPITLFIYFIFTLFIVIVALISGKSSRRPKHEM